MKIGIDLPEDVAHALEKEWGDLALCAIKLLAVEGFRSGVLTPEQLHRTLSLKTRLEVEIFLKKHGIDFDRTTGDRRNDGSMSG
jgi:hypothetical protein